MITLKTKFLILSLTFVFSGSLWAQVSFDTANLKTNRKYSCLLIDGVWEPGKVSRSLFYSELANINALTVRLTAETNKNKRKRLSNSIAAGNKRRNRAITNYCGKLDIPETAAVTSLASLPNSSELLSSAGLNSLAVSGTPPTIASMNSIPLKNVFWNSGVIDAIIGNTASPSQCGEFYPNLVNGVSGSFDACYTAQDVASTVSDLIASGVSLCYMRNVGTAANILNGSLSVVSGSLPGNDPTQIFSVPSGSTSRVVQIRISGLGEDGPAEGFYIVIKSSGENAILSNQYSYTINSCRGSGSTPTETEETSVKTDNRYISDVLAGGENSFSASVRAYITESGGVVSFDTARDRSIQIVSEQGGNSFKGDMTLTPSNYILAKRYGVFTDQVFKSYNVTRFSATSMSTLRMLESAFHRATSFDGGATVDDAIGAVEYQDTNYKMSTSNVFLPWLSSVDFSVDSFYTSPPSVPGITSSFNCNNVTPDIVVAVNMTTPTMRAISQACEGERLRGVDFCQSDAELSAASQNFVPACSFLFP